MESSQEKSLPASERKLQKARGDGQGARSRDLSHLAILGAGAACMLLLAPTLMDHMQLAAAELGLGTCWIGAFDPAAARDILGLPDGVEIVGMTPLGVPDIEPNPRPRSRRPLGETVMKERWG